VCACELCKTATWSDEMRRWLCTDLFCSLLAC
jgi:hypothetical protein